MATTKEVVQPQDLHMKQVKAFLDAKAQTDQEFAVKYLTSGKTMKGCMKHLYKRGLEFIVMKGVNLSKGKCDVADVPNEIAHQHAVEYFMDDSINMEKDESSANTKVNTKTKTKTKTTPNSYLLTPNSPNSPVANAFAVAPTKQQNNKATKQQKKKPTPNSSLLTPNSPKTPNYNSLDEYDMFADL